MNPLGNNSINEPLGRLTNFTRAILKLQMPAKIWEISFRLINISISAFLVSFKRFQDASPTRAEN